jgi:transposase IS66-like protein
LGFGAGYSRENAAMMSLTSDKRDLGASERSLNGVDPQAYLADVLTRYVDRHPMSRLDELAPFAYLKPASAKAMKQRRLH